jgi:DNA-3-methyladenine glycosylase II
MGRIIKSQECVDEGAQYLASIEPRFNAVLPDLSPLPLRLRTDGFPALLSAVVSQQISVASAASVWARLEAAELITVDAVQSANDEMLRECGLSRPKVKYAKGIAEADMDFSELHKLPTDDVIRSLVALKGIGRWTAEIYAMFSLGRADVFPVGDIALQEAAKVMFDLEARPNEKDFDELAAKWAPWRSVAARLLWAYYRTLKNREGIRE